MKTKSSTLWDTLKAEGKVRLRIEPDEHASLEDLEGDMFNPKVNGDIPEAQLKEDREAFIERVNRDGVWGMIGEYWNGEAWEHADSSWGFIGDDWSDNGYDDDIKAATIKAYKKQKHCPTCKRPTAVK